ncbi:polyribonucleotide nucleotidyltransferase [Candidatus Dependentiae bacterium]|nr:polyribonucleotide nucleotidyltransferase [Candidatus Dependentiae bacterium]
MYNPIIVEKEIAGKKITIETGRMAKQAHGSVLITCGGTSVLSTVCYMSSEDDAVRDFFPLTVNYIEKYYAAGKFPGGFLKREGKVSDRETLIARLTDRPMRPLFPKSFKSEVQIVSTVISSDSENSGDILSMIGSSAAVCISEIPFNGPVGAVKIGRINGEFIINPTAELLEKSDFEIIVAGTSDAIMMVEGVAKIVPEEDLVAALEYAHKCIKLIVEMQNELVSKCGKPKLALTETAIPADFEKEVREFLGAGMEPALFIKAKKERAKALGELMRGAKEKFADKIAADSNYNKFIMILFEEMEYEILRGAILNRGQRVDGRGLTDIRPITSEVSVLKNTHGSALFTRGETQSLGIVTLGTSQDMQNFDTIEGSGSERFTLHYNFPPFSVGEVKRMGSPGRREIGHGNLAKRALEGVLPSIEEFPYAIRVVSEILESNGSSSQASVCSGCLCLMDAGVPIKAPVAGIAMGLIKEGNNYKVLSDILGAEDHLGDMDFKIAGTVDGVTAIQMDIKIAGLTFDIMRTALTQAKAGRLHIINEMSKCLAKPKPELSPNAPKITQMQIDIEKIKDLIGPGGKNIRSITEKTGVKIDIREDGMVNIAGSDQQKVQDAIKLIKGAIKDVEIGAVYDGIAKRVENFGVFVEIMPGCEGLVHVSELQNGFVKNAADVVKVGDEMKVRLLEIDRQGRLNLSKKRV